MTEKSFKENADKQPSYKKVVTIWARFDSWEIGSGIDLLLERPPQVLGYVTAINDELERQRRLLIEFAYGSVGITLPVVGTLPHNKDEIRVTPSDFLDWAERKDIQVPEILRNAVEHVDDLALLEGAKSSRELIKICRSHGIELPQSVRLAIRDFSDNQRMHQRCRGIASVIWDEDPKLTKVDVATHDWIIRLGCHGRSPGEETMKRWLKGLNPNKNPGRRRKERG